ncbi:Hybrid signal transduction histidine kinase K [Acrodontium crateriforme]|uniref:Hybrid signal transduction histidine kinase K n=1 Tax=Acrodontium crateriforme TaxID=150365 RepID=A0AAQ3M2W3_9PEZI|nr:Hybrid signal transduction histidine kinase K [Acrodontium crateriforme]
MNANDKPSVFSSRDSFNRTSGESSLTGAEDRGPHPNTPTRRESTPNFPQTGSCRASPVSTEQRQSRPQAISPGAGALPAQTRHFGFDAPSPTWALTGEINIPEKKSENIQLERPASVSQTQNSSLPKSTRLPEFQLPKTPSVASRNPEQKRAQEKSFSEPPSKRLRLRGPRSKHTIDSFSYPSPIPRGFEPPSPLFFSNSPRPRPSLPPRFSSSEAAARMLSKARNEDSHVKTVSLARGTVTSSGMPTSYPRPDSSSRQSFERSSAGRSNSPDSAYSNQENILNSIGIIELLDQDERPTFVVDLADSSNYGSGPLRPVFANASLRAYAGMLELVTGTGSDESTSTPQMYAQFKGWLLSASEDGESLNVCLPSFQYAGMGWSCSTLRKRWRIIGGSFPIAQPSNMPKTLSLPPATNSVPSTTNSDLMQGRSSGIIAEEPKDYFGEAVNFDPPSALSVTSSFDNKAAVVPTIESSIHIPWPSDAFMHVAAATDLLPSPHTYVKDLSNDVCESISQNHVDGPTSRIPVVPADAPSFDWTRIPTTDSMPSHIKFARSVDWASTSLGPMETWDSDLRQMCNLIMASPHPAAMYWGEEYVAIYNEAYILLAGQKHPTLMGQSYRVAWAEIWDEVKDVFASARLTGEATMKDDDCLFLRRSNYLEETYFSWSIIPMVGRDGSVKGLYNPAFEKTRRKIAERRMLTLREVGERTAAARDVKAFWSQVLASFEFNEYDSPFVLLYSVADETDSDSSSMHSSSLIGSQQCLLEGSLGVPKGHPAAESQLDLKSGVLGFAPVFREAMKNDRPILLDVGSRELPYSLLDGLEARGFGDPVRSVVACPIHPTTGDSILGFVVLGVNPRRPFDDDYSLFVQLLSRQLATSLASVVLFEEEIRRGQRAAKLAALDRIELSEQLAARTQEAMESETKFTRMAEFAPVGMFIAGSSGRITFANDTWYDISRVPKNAAMANTWMNAIHPDDLALVKRLWDDLVIRTKSVSSEFRFKAQWEDRGTRGDTWVLFSAYPEKYPDGKLKSIFGSITNISSQKWAEGIQTRKMEEAIELKRQTSNFIDITSHEMRNPLSAILQCSDEIAGSLIKYRDSKEKEKDLPDELVASCLDAAQVISLCSQHQKRIVDDILTLSKLDSKLLLVTPVDAQPLTVVQRALKMHEGELQAADIQMKFVVDKSFRDLGLDWVRFDPSRVLQVLINLTTNAIKFTGTENKRTITVSIGASDKRPSENTSTPVKYIPTRNPRELLTMQNDWGNGEQVYIHFSVNDTGRGLNAEEKKMLFLRFSQASPRTHVQYGGSGLGLFISRELTELQGGEIGVESEAGKGSTFAFYVVARRSNAPEDTDGATGIKRPSASSIPNVPFQTETPNGKPASELGNKKPATPRRLSSWSTNAASSSVKKVLIVEDNLVNQRVLQKQLKNIGTEVHLANHGGEALEKLRQSTYWSGPGGPGTLELGVVLMDQEMPVMDGLTCTRKIRELEAEGKLTGHIPIIAVTANARAEQVQIALEAGMDDVVSKPFRIPDLLPKIEELISRYPMPLAVPS